MNHMTDERIRVSCYVLLPGGGNHDRHCGINNNVSKQGCGSVMWFKYYRGYYDVRKSQSDSVSFSLYSAYCSILDFSEKYRFYHVGSIIMGLLVQNFNFIQSSLLFYYLNKFRLDS